MSIDIFVAYIILLYLFCFLLPRPKHGTPEPFLRHNPALPLRLHSPNRPLCEPHDPIRFLHPLFTRSNRILRARIRCNPLLRPRTRTLIHPYVPQNIPTVTTHITDRRAQETQDQLKQQLIREVFIEQRDVDADSPGTERLDRYELDARL